MEDSLRVSEKGNESLNIYLRYFLFHDFKRRLSLKDNEALLRFIQRLSLMSKKLFYPFELSLIAHYSKSRYSLHKPDESSLEVKKVSYMG